MSQPKVKIPMLLTDERLKYINGVLDSIALLMNINRPTMYDELYEHIRAQEVYIEMLKGVIRLNQNKGEKVV